MRSAGPSSSFLRAGQQPGSKRRRLVALLAAAGPAGVPVAALAEALGMRVHTLHTHVCQMNRHPPWPAIVGSGAGRGRRGRFWLAEQAPKEPWRYPEAVG
jgi:hypothetical protein